MYLKCKNNGSYTVYNTNRLDDAIRSGSVYMEKTNFSTIRGSKNIYRYMISKNGGSYTSFYRVEFGSDVMYKRLSQAIRSDF